jgi:glycosyltransferase involved in cell wall biosynthesis
VYWFSQTIGPGRGLELFIKAMGKARGLATLSLRGSDFLGYSAQLKKLASEVGAADSIRFLPSAPPDEMVRLAAQHDIGLASELTTPPNHGICLSNKIFTYLLAGIPVLMSDTPAQRELAADLGEAARVVDLTEPATVASVLCSLARDGEALAAAKCAAAQLAHTRYNWNVEKEGLRQSVQNAMAGDGKLLGLKQQHGQAVPR